MPVDFFHRADDPVMIRFQVQYVFLVLAHERRRILHLGVTAHPTAEWAAQLPRETPSVEGLAATSLRMCVRYRAQATETPDTGLRCSRLSFFIGHNNIVLTQRSLHSQHRPGLCHQAPTRRAASKKRRSTHVPLCS
jgi:hypothetical protein